MAVLKQKLAMGNTDIALIQEPWGQGGQIRGSGGTFVFSCTQYSINILNLCKE
jgi:hypothetical protein